MKDLLTGFAIAMGSFTSFAIALVVVGYCLHLFGVTHIP